MAKRIEFIKLPSPDMKRRMKGKFVERRTWLNTVTNLTAFIAVQECQLKIMDCGRVTTLDFYLSGYDDTGESSKTALQQDFNEKMAKLQRLANALRLMEDNLVVQHNREWTRIHDEAKAKKAKPNGG